MQIRGQQGTPRMPGTVRGWTIRQWGIAIKRAGHRPRTWEEAMNLYDEWQRRTDVQPGQVQIAGGDYSADLEGAQHVWRLAVQQGVLPGRRR